MTRGPFLRAVWRQPAMLDDDGDPFDQALSAAPASAFLAERSEVAVHRGVRLRG